MTLQERIDVLVKLGEYIQNNGHDWEASKRKAENANPWFMTEFIDKAAYNITTAFSQKDKLEAWTKTYNVPNETIDPKTVGLVMAGNIPMVGFHDMLCIFTSGHKQLIKLSSKDNVLLPHLVTKMQELQPAVSNYISFAEKIAGCDAYIATGSNNTSRYFEYYFGKYPHIIRKNRTSVAVLDGTENAEELDKLADDIQLYFGLGCRNITKIYVPKGYDFEPLLNALRKYDHYADQNKYKNNYDYQLALLMMGNKFYMTNESILLAEESSLFTAVSRVNYEYYDNKEALTNELKNNADIQCVVGHNAITFGQAQQPKLDDYADGIDTMSFLLTL